MHDRLRSADVPLTLTLFDPIHVRVFPVGKTSKRVWNEEDAKVWGTDRAWSSTVNTHGCRVHLTFADVARWFQTDPEVVAPHRYTLTRANGSTREVDLAKAAVPLMLGGTLRDDRRKGNNVESYTVVILDVDENTTIEQAQDELTRMGCGWLISTTISHTPERHKFRILIPLDRPAAPDEYYKIACYLLRRFGADTASASRSQAFFTPTVRLGNEHLYRTAQDTEAEPLKVEKVLEQAKQDESNYAKGKTNVASFRVTSSPRCPARETKKERRVREVRETAVRREANESVWAHFPDLTGSGRGGVRRASDRQVLRAKSRYVVVGPIAIPKVLDVNPLRSAVLNEPLIALSRCIDISRDAWRTIAQSVWAVCRGVPNGDAIAQDLFHEISEHHAGYDFDETACVLAECAAYLEDAEAGPRLYPAPGEEPGFEYLPKHRTPAAHIRNAMRRHKVEYAEELYTGLPASSAVWTAVKRPAPSPAVDVDVLSSSRADLGDFSASELFQGGVKVACIRSPMGTGKTTMVANWKVTRRLFVTTRRTQARGMAVRLSANCYLEAIGDEGAPPNIALFKNAAWTNNLVISVDSLHYLDPDLEYDLVVLDECEAVFPQFLKETVVKRGGPEPRLRALQGLLKNAGRVLLMDAYLGPTSMETIIELMGNRVRYRYIVNEPPAVEGAPERHLRLYSLGEMEQRAQRALLDRNGHIYCGSKVRAKALKLQGGSVEDLVIIVVSGDHDDPEERPYIADPTGYTARVRAAGKRLIVVHTSALSDTLSNQHPDMTYLGMIGHAKTSGSVQMLLQTTGRCRNVREVEAYIPTSGTSEWDTSVANNASIFERRGAAKTPLTRRVGPIIAAGIARGAAQPQFDFACAMRHAGWVVTVHTTPSPETRRAVRDANAARVEAEQLALELHVQSVMNAPRISFATAKALSGRCPDEDRLSVKRAFLEDAYGELTEDVVVFNGMTDAGLRKVENHAPVRALLEGGDAEAGLREEDTSDLRHSGPPLVSQVAKAELVVGALEACGARRKQIGVVEVKIQKPLDVIRYLERHALDIAAFYGVPAASTMNSPFRTLAILCRTIGLDLPDVGSEDGKRRYVIGTWLPVAKFAHAKLEKYRRAGALRRPRRAA